MLTSVFFGLAPPNSTISLPCRAIDDHEVSGPITDCGLPRMCGRKASAAAEAVVHHLIDEAAAGCKETMQLHPRLVEDASRRPALRAAHDGLRAVLAADPL